MKQEIKDKMVQTTKEKQKLGLTICWDCDNAGKIGCEWFRCDKPVPGWEAELVPYIATYHTSGYIKRVETETYVVRYCPKFKKIQRGEN